MCSTDGISNPGLVEGKLNKIVYLVGESGCGKTTLCQELEKEGYKSVKVIDIKELKKMTTDAVIIYLKCDRQHRYIRMMHRGNKPDETFKKLRRDEEVFATVPCNYVIDVNCSFDKVIKRVKKVLEVEKFE